MNARTPPPRGLRWLEAWPTRAVVLSLAVVALLMSIYVGYRYVRLVDCLAARDAADQRRTAAVAAATDVERAADLALIRGGGQDARAAAIAARVHTDAVRAAHPAPPVHPCQ